MPEEIGKIQKPAAEGFKSERKLYYIPLLFSGKDSQAELTELFKKYWEQTESQIENLENKLGQVRKIYHELISKSGNEGLSLLKDLNEYSYKIAQARMEKGAQLESIEDEEILEELMDWSRCLSMNLQSQKVVSKIYGFYDEANKKRNESIAKKLDENLKPEESGILFMGENHRVQFPSSIRIIYVSPPALDEIKRWIRNQNNKKSVPSPENPEPPNTGKDSSQS
jgi:hypothetical protein